MCFFIGFMQHGSLPRVTRHTYVFKVLYGSVLGCRAPVSGLTLIKVHLKPKNAVLNWRYMEHLGIRTIFGLHAAWKSGIHAVAELLVQMRIHAAPGYRPLACMRSIPMPIQKRTVFNALSASSSSPASFCSFISFDKLFLVVQHLECFLIHMI